MITHISIIDLFQHIFTSLLHAKALSSSGFHSYFNMWMERSNALPVTSLIKVSPEPTTPLLRPGGGRNQSGTNSQHLVHPFLLRPSRGISAPVLPREAGGHASEETSRSLERGGENTLLFWAQERRFIALHGTGWRQIWGKAGCLAG